MPALDSPKRRLRPARQARPVRAGSAGRPSGTPHRTGSPDVGQTDRRQGPLLRNRLSLALPNRRALSRQVRTDGNSSRAAATGVTSRSAEPPKSLRGRYAPVRRAGLQREGLRMRVVRCRAGACVLPAPMGKVARLAAVLSLAVLFAATAASQAQASVSMCNVPMTMSDGTVLRANIFLPSSTGHFPTILTATGYNKDAANPTGQDCSASQGIAGDEPGLTEKGFAVMVFDDRGTGASGGRWESWDARTQQDYKEVLDWIQEQPWSNSSVATTGQSYMGITSLLIAEADAARVAEGKALAVKSIWADIPMADAYRDVTFQGGSVNASFIPLWLGLVGTLSALPPSSLSANPEEAASIYLEHLLNNVEFGGEHVVGASLGEEPSY